jgi:hypothetical protein
VRVLGGGEGDGSVELLVVGGEGGVVGEHLVVVGEGVGDGVELLVVGGEGVGVAGGQLLVNFVFDSSLLHFTSKSA